MGAPVVAALRQLLRGLAARRWSSLALLLTGALTVAAATLGPLYARAAQESVLHDALTSAPAEDVGLHIAFGGDVTSASSFQTAEQNAPPAGLSPAYPTRVVGARTNASVVSPGSAEPAQSTRVVARDDVCAHVVVVAGRCATGAGDAMLSTRTLAGGYGYRLGAPVAFPGLAVPQSGPIDQIDTDPPPAALTLVGVYRPVDPADPYWFGVRYFDEAVSYSDSAADTVDAVLVGRDALAGLGGARGEIDVDYPLDPDALRLADLGRVTRTVTSTVTVLTSASVTVTDPLPDRLTDLGAERRKVETGSLLVSLQLAALALLVLFAATADALDARGGDVALAKLRGLTPGATLRFLLLEPVLLLVLAVPTGALLGWAATALLGHAVLVAGVPLVFPAAAGVAAVVAFVGALVAAALAGRRVLTRPVLDQWRGSRRDPGRRRLGLVLDLVLAAAAVTGLVLLATGSSGTWSLLAPGLLVLAVALLGVRLLPLVVRVAVPRTHGSSRLGAYLALRQVGRRPAALRLAVLLAVAVGLAVFGVGGESVASGNRVDRAHVEVGAPRRVAVQFDALADPVALSRKADPDGRWAMVAAQWLPGGGQTVTGAVVGVDATALAAVAFPSTQGPTTATIARDVGPAAPPITLTGTSVRLSVTAASVTGPAPFVDAVVVPTGRARTLVRLGVLQTGAHDYRGDVPCAGGCVFAGVGWERPVSTFDTIAASVRVTTLAVGSGSGALRGVDLRLTAAGGWHARSPDATDDGTGNRLTTDASGITDVFTSSSGSSAGMEPPSVPQQLPVWATPGAVIRPPDQDDGGATPLRVQDDFGNDYPIRVVGTTAALPGVPPGGVVADVGALRAELPGFAGEAAWSVWLGADAPPDALARLDAAGLTTGGVTSAADRLTRLGRQGPALALALLLACALAAAVLAIGATATAIAATGRRRAFELAALRVLGVPRRALTRATVLEQLLLLGTAVLLGVPSGVLAALVAMPVIPQFSDTSPLPLSDVPSPWPVVTIAAVFVVLLVVTAVVAGVALVRSAVPSRLREAA